jgi:hypothetical protein
MRPELPTRPRNRAMEKVGTEVKTARLRPKGSHVDPQAYSRLCAQAKIAEAGSDFIRSFSARKAFADSTTPCF